jgi:GNAT superfamily N-acetyltransferase
LFFANHTLARRLEAAETFTCRCYGGPTESIDYAGGVAMFAGVGSPLTHAIGTGMHGVVSPAEIEAMEQFYRSRGSHAEIDLCPLADEGYLPQLSERGYRVVELNNVLARVISGDLPPADPRVASGDGETYSRVVAEGFFGPGEPPPEMLAIGAALSSGPLQPYLAYVDGRAVAGGTLNICENTGFFFGDATVNSARGLGLQRALVETRLAAAAAAGCDLAFAATLPGSQSQRNYERCGFRVVYTKLTLRRVF